MEAREAGCATPYSAQDGPASVKDLAPMSRVLRAGGDAGLEQERERWGAEV